jgi:hypothetical protein
LGVRYLRGTDFGTGEAYQEFAVEFDYAEEGGELEFRTHSYGTSDLWVDRVSVTSYPADLPLQADGPFLTSWTLPAREGPARIGARFVDGAENASPEVALMVTVTDRSPPGGWRQFRCSGMTCTVQVRDTIAGLDTKSAAYRAAVGSDPSWGDWLPATCTGVDGSHDWETLTITDPAISATASSNSIQFRVYDLAAVPNEARSLVYTLYRVYLPLVMRSGG